MISQKHQSHLAEEPPPWPIFRQASQRAFIIDNLQARTSKNGHHGRSSSIGFTLLEVLIALAVISIALGAAIRASGFGADKAYALQQRTLAGWVASNAINTLLAARSFPPMGALEGQAKAGPFEFIWRQETGPTPNLSFRRVEIKVFAAAQPDDLLARQVSYVARVEN